MGGLVLRCYLSGKQNSAGVFQPPTATHVRKAVFLATPHFGTPIASYLPIVNQVKEMSSGSAFLFDLATWNDATDDLRGVDAIAAAGNAGTGLLTGDRRIRRRRGAAHQRVFALLWAWPYRVFSLTATSRAAAWSAPFGLCPGSAKGIANIDSASHESAQIIVSFFNGTNAWQSVGTAAENDPFLSVDGGLIVAAYDANDSSLNVEFGTAATGDTRHSAAGHFFRSSRFHRSVSGRRGCR